MILALSLLIGSGFADTTIFSADFEDALDQNI